jgi:hypothetical protein
MRRPAKGIIALAMIGAACAIPTDAPNWDMTWNLPVPDDNALSISVTKLLPSGVDTITPAGTTTLALIAKINGTPSINRTLGVQCPSCPTATAQKPAFTAPTATSVINLSAGTSLNTATLFTGSQIVVTLNNGFTFDPINPPGGSPGTVTLTVSNGATTLGTLTLQGPAQTIPAGVQKQFTVSLSGTINTAQPITVAMTMDSPAGDAGSPVQMNPNDPFTATAVPTLNVSGATVTIGAQSLNSATGTAIDLSDLDSAIVNRITPDNQARGAMYLTVTNPFTVGANATITLRSPAGGTLPPITPITKPVIIAAAASAGTPTISNAVIDLTGNELRSILGREIEAVFGGATDAGSTSVTPTQSITATSRIQVNFNLKEQP